MKTGCAFGNAIDPPIPTQPAFIPSRTVTADLLAASVVALLTGIGFGLVSWCVGGGVADQSARSTFDDA